MGLGTYGWAEHSESVLSFAISQRSQRENKRNTYTTHITKEIQQFSERLCILFHVYRSNIKETEHKGYVMLIYISRLK